MELTDVTLPNLLFSVLLRLHQMKDSNCSLGRQLYSR
jgi:hypothetical protein